MAPLHAAPGRKFRVAALRNDDYPIRMEELERTLGDVASVVEVDVPFRPLAPGEEEALIARIGACDGLFVRAGNITRNIIGKVPGLKVVTVHGAGVDQVDLEAAREHGVIVTNCPGANAQSVAELTIGLIIALMRNVVGAAWRVAKEGVWDAARTVGSELGGKTLGVVGLGNVGRKVARLGVAFGMEVLAHDPFVAEAEPPVSLVPLDLLLEQADVVSVHVPLTEETRHLIGAGELRRMKGSSVLVNTSRGPLVDQEALCRALREGWIRGAALDVVDPEPPAPGEPLFQLPNVIVTPHLGGSTHDCLQRIARMGAEDLRRVLLGEEPLYRVC